MGKRVLTQMTTRIMPRRAAPGTRAAIGVQPPAVKPSLALFALLVVAVSSGAACKRQIGDDCKTATDCDPSGARACDLSQPGGYCTIQGCNETTCPSEATCIRYFPAQYLTKPCNPAAEDRLPTDAGTDADVDGGDDAGGGRPGLRNDCAANEICLSSGLCAPLASELRFCVKVCSDNGDCRQGYECRLAGREGSEILSSVVGATTSFCAPSIPTN
jgi:hypothetical protein